MKHIRAGDTVWGTGVMRETDVFPQAKDVTFLAVRGPLSRDILVKSGATVPAIYGDPGLLLPLMYTPVYKKTHKVGYIPHYVDKAHIQKTIDFESGENLFIDVALPWKDFVDQVLKCERVISSSLHGIVIAEAYGIPATWEEYSDKVIGKGFKFRDYMLGTFRGVTVPGEELAPVKMLDLIQQKLVHSLSTLSTTSK
jgi:pyruvyltransferase